MAVAIMLSNDYTVETLTSNSSYQYTIDLGAVKEIKFISVYSNGIYSGGNSSVNVSVDNETFVQLYSNKTAYNQMFDVGNYRYIKLNVRLSSATKTYINYVYK